MKPKSNPRCTCGADDCQDCNPQNFVGGVYVENVEDDTDCYEAEIRAKEERDERMADRDRDHAEHRRGEREQ